MKIRLQIKAYDYKLMNQVCDKICSIVTLTNATLKGPVPMPTRRRIFCVLRSPHVNKDAREHFEIKTYKRLIDIQNSSLQTIDSLKQLNLPAGIDLCVNFI
jgi:small subunit ribosomal protein S10